MAIVSYIKGLPGVIDDVETLSELSSSYVPDGQAQVDVPASLN
jgi:hypothetical protein